MPLFPLCTRVNVKWVNVHRLDFHYALEWTLSESTFTERLYALRKQNTWRKSHQNAMREGRMYVREKLLRTSIIIDINAIWHVFIREGLRWSHVFIHYSASGFTFTCYNWALKSGWLMDSGEQKKYFDLTSSGTSLNPLSSITIGRARAAMRRLSHTTATAAAAAEVIIAAAAIAWWFWLC